ncbi:MAG: hypothetical protein AAGE59_17015 [Cyanobacteria bacterium P01_F01_bin.86]
MEISKNSADYLMLDVTIGASEGAGIHTLDGDLIAIVEGLDATDLDLTSSDQFIYV